MADSEGATGQTALFPPQDPEATPPPATVFVVTAVYADDPHAHVEGVFHEEAAAEALMDRCRDRFTPPHPVAWGVHEEAVE